MVFYQSKLRDWIDINKLDWYYLSKNENAIELLSSNLDKINWYWLSSNPSILTYDYRKVKEKNKKLNEEIIELSLNPDRIEKLINIYGKEEIIKNYF